MRVVPAIVAGLPGRRCGRGTCPRAPPGKGARDFLLDLLTLGQPYLADIAPQPTTARDYQFQLRRAGGTTFVCTDGNGNQTSKRVPDGQSFSQVDAGGANFLFNVQALLASLEWDQGAFAPAPVARCDVTLRVVGSVAGALAPDFHAFSILQATQVRSVRILLRRTFSRALRPRPARSTSAR